MIMQSNCGIGFRERTSLYCASYRNKRNAYSELKFVHVLPKISSSSVISYLKLPPNRNILDDQLVREEELGSAREDVQHALHRRRGLAVLLVVVMDSAERRKIKPKLNDLYLYKNGLVRHKVCPTSVWCLSGFLSGLISPHYSFAEGQNCVHRRFSI